MNRRTLLKLFGGAGLAALSTNALLLEPNRLHISRHALKSLPQPGTKPTPQAGSLTFAQISDLHIKKIDRFTRKVAARITQLNPDVILLTGDIVDRSYTLPILNQFLALLPEKTPKYAILGNWENHSKVDLAALRQTYAAHGCQLLLNQSVIHRHQQQEILLTGLDDTVEGRPDLVKALADVAPKRHHLILAHAPDQRDRFSQDEQKLIDRFQPQYMLSGHTHGGQITFLGFAPVLPRGSGSYVKGWYRESLPQLYVSRGLGGSGTRARLGAMPEIALFEWQLG
jgi:uncharacterized protein